jgi:type I restriction enzyme S subunit
MKAEEQRAEYAVGSARLEAVIHQDNAAGICDNWPVLAIEEVADVNPRVDKAAIPNELPVSFVSMPKVGAGGGSIHVEETRPASEVKKGFTAFLEGDVLFAKITPCMENGKMAVVPKLVNGYGFGSTEFHVLRPKPGMDAKYLYYYVSSQAFRGEAERYMTGAVGQKRVSTTYLKQSTIPVAPPDQQKRIVAEIEKQFSRLDEAIANLKRVKANLKRYKAAVLKTAVEGRLVETEAELARREGRSYETGTQLLQRILETRRSQWKGKGKYREPAAPDTTDLPELPEGWVWASIEQLTWLVTSGSRGWGDYYSETGVLFIRAQDIKTDLLNIRGAARVNIPADAEGSRSSVSSQDILVTITGANVTKSALVPPLEEVAFVSQHVALLKLNLPEIASFVFSWIVSPSNGRKILESWAYGAGKPGLSLEQIRSLPVALPPLPEQRNINAEVDRHLSLADEAVAQVNANLKRAERLRQSILSRAYVGGFTASNEVKSSHEEILDV